MASFARAAVTSSSTLPNSIMKATRAAPQYSPITSEATMAMVTSSSTLTSRFHNPAIAPRAMTAPPTSAPTQPVTTLATDQTGSPPPTSQITHEMRVRPRVRKAETNSVPVMTSR